MLTFETRIHRSVIFVQVNLISVAPMLQKFEDPSQEETEWQERCGREAAWKSAKNIEKLKEKHKTILLTFGIGVYLCLQTNQTKENLL